MSTDELISNYKEVFTQKFAKFDGRAGRKEFWYFVLVNVVVSIVLNIIDGAIFSTTVLSGLYGLAVLIPGLALTARRLHDINKSGWWQLIALIPIVGLIILIIWCAKEGDKGTNNFGEEPAE
ncbi:MAG: DUF805 domain-containing protein [Paludibacteraceae bacterium]|nr:DUF805 domain-containing protein [Paludibacteraceae bacterium]